MTNTKGFLNRNQLKYLVIAAMLIDHIAWAFVPTASLLGQVMHIIGRLTGPTMAYMLAEGYRYTRSVKKYAMRLGIFAVISWLPFSYFESGGIRPAFGVIYTLFLSLLAIWFWDKAKYSVSVKWLAVLLLWHIWYICPDNIIIPAALLGHLRSKLLLERSAYLSFLL